ncbi:MAG: adenosine deaminase [Alphaproteobacteria bacterium]|nr:adenosine deaminase [Alphaproteobacteria bacterium]
MRELIEAMPKVELHMHLEGSLEADLLFALAARNRVDIGFASEAALRAAYDFKDLKSFLDVYYAGLRVLITEQDFYDMTWAYLSRVRRDNVEHTEVFLAPQAHLRRGIAYGTMMDGVTRAIADAKSRLGITCGLILVFQRQFSEDDAFATLRAGEAFAGHVVGYGLGGPEVGNRPGKFARVFAEIRAQGFKLVAHAGEEGGADYVREAVEALGVDRIDHGVRCEEDGALVQELAASRIPLTVCPLSNLKLRVVQRLEDHNIARLLRAGLNVTMNSDDPSYFGGYMNDNYVATQRAVGLTREEIRTLARNAVSAAFVDATRRGELARSLEAYWAAR